MRIRDRNIEVLLLLLVGSVAFHTGDASSNNGPPPPPPPSSKWRATPPPPPEKGYVNPLDPTQKLQASASAAASEAIDSNMAAGSDTSPPPPQSSLSSSWNQEGNSYPGISRTSSEADKRRNPEDEIYYDDNERGDNRQAPPPSNSDDHTSTELSSSTTTKTTTRTPTKIQPIEIDPRDSKHVPIHYNFGKDDVGKKPTKKGRRGFFFGRRQNDDKDDDDNNDTKEREERTNMDGFPSSSTRDRLVDRDAPRRRVGDDFEQRRRDEEEDPSFRGRRRGRYDDEDSRGGKYYEDDSRDRRREDDVYRSENNDREKDRRPQYASARRDVITRYQSTATGKLMLTLSCGLVGSIVGAFLGKSILNRPVGMALTWSVIFIVCTLLRNPYGELVRALGMSIILALQRTTSIRRRYPTWRHIKASLGASERRPFPPTSNPWSYEPRRDFDPEFRMLFTVIAMAFVGSTCGGSVPLIPTWIGSLVGAGFFGLSTTMQSARVSLCCLCII